MRRISNEKKDTHTQLYGRDNRVYKYSRISYSMTLILWPTAHNLPRLARSHQVLTLPGIQCLTHVWTHMKTVLPTGPLSELLSQLHVHLRYFVLRIGIQVTECMQLKSPIYT